MSFEVFTAQPREHLKILRPCTRKLYFYYPAKKLGGDISYNFQLVLNARFVKSPLKGAEAILLLDTFPEQCQESCMSQESSNVIRNRSSRTRRSDYFLLQ